MTYYEYLDLLIEAARQNVPTGETCVTAAALGNYLRAAVPDVTYRTFGKASMLAILEELELAGRLKLVRTTKNALAIEPLAVVGTDSIHKIEPVPRAVFNPLHVNVWNAFVLGAPTGRRFMHRSTGMVRSVLESAPSPADEWVEIVPISVATQHEWATEFVDNKVGEHAGVARAALSGEAWHPRAFVLALKSANDGLARSWNLFRSQRVSEVVRQWLDQHAIAHHLVFNTEARVTSGAAASAVSDDAGRDETRRAILAALSTLSLEQLLDLRIPARAMLTAFQSMRR